ncbi:hypothetical protein [Saccharopolyspora pogona]|uniref:hypothetical protein n=1 Tax=Saccharopolyspora pogona TaxID=333966 RepID=UPI00168933E8|nr:hypothetical protein [Saccharopolyspora pogona]
MGELLLPAAELGLSVRYTSPNAAHDPTRVYVTTDEGVAAAFASRYLVAGDRPVPGDLYEVQSVGSTEEDPDYQGHSPGMFLSCRRARIVRRVASGLALS